MNNQLSVDDNNKNDNNNNGNSSTTTITNNHPNSSSEFIKYNKLLSAQNIIITNSNSNSTCSSILPINFNIGSSTTNTATAASLDVNVSSTSNFVNSVEVASATTANANDGIAVGAIAPICDVFTAVDGGGFVHDDSNNNNGNNDEDEDENDEDDGGAGGSCSGGDYHDDVDGDNTGGSSGSGGGIGVGDGDVATNIDDAEAATATFVERTAHTGFIPLEQLNNISNIVLTRSEKKTFIDNPLQAQTSTRAAVKTIAYRNMPDISEETLFSGDSNSNSNNSDVVVRNDMLVISDMEMDMDDESVEIDGVADLEDDSDTVQQLLEIDATTVLATANILSDNTAPLKISINEQLVNVPSFLTANSPTGRPEHGCRHFRSYVREHTLKTFRIVNAYFSSCVNREARIHKVK